MQGTVKWFNGKKGYGFVTGEDNEDYFVHYSVIKGDGFKALNEGDKVTYEWETSSKGKQCTSVTLVRG